VMLWVAYVRAKMFGDVVVCLDEKYTLVVETETYSLPRPRSYYYIPRP
jgi:hypothetical protein